MAGHYFLNGSRIPVSSKWESWIEEVEHVYHGMHAEMHTLCESLVQTAVSKWQKSA